jgi:2-keto-4-pentenoate hydratase/2-oxohepta-3-ene-1,7-dioic acid hydratase in catechol pathway
MISPENIRNIWAVGRNYTDHAKELGNAVPSSPLIFLKAGSTLVSGHKVPVSRLDIEVHHEIELVLQFDQNLNISHMGLALDLTDRAAQNILKAQGQPWTLAKSFKYSCPVSPLVAVSSVSDLSDLEIELKINGDIRQAGKTSQMIFSLPVLVDFVKKHVPVCPGDLLLTGTPSGVGALKVGDKLEARLGNKLQQKWEIT